VPGAKQSENRCEKSLRSFQFGTLPTSLRNVAGETAPLMGSEHAPYSPFMGGLRNRAPPRLPSAESARRNDPARPTRRQPSHCVPGRAPATRRLTKGPRPSAEPVLPARRPRLSPTSTGARSCSPLVTSTLALGQALGHRKRGDVKPPRSVGGRVSVKAWVSTRWRGFGTLLGGSRAARAVLPPPARQAGASSLGGGRARGGPGRGGPGAGPTQARSPTAAAVAVAPTMSVKSTVASTGSGSAPRRMPGEELLDLIEQRVGVANPRKVIRAGELHEAGAGMCSEIQRPLPANMIDSDPLRVWSRGRARIGGSWAHRNKPSVPGEGDAAALHARVQVEDRPGGRRV
jgi:hypothetical protein